MTPDNMAKKQAASKEESQSSSSKKATSARPQELALKCPRCDSMNTKFCYFNNYSLAQPRHFCKTCRRYWTKGGTLRNVPIGGGCRKNKRMKSSSRFPSGGGSRDHSSSSSDIGGLKLFHGFSPAMDFQLGGLNFPRLQTSSTAGVYNHQFSSFGDISSTPCFSLDHPSGFSSAGPLMGFNFSLPPLAKEGEFQEMGSSVNVNGNIASSIESLSSINQDLHWKLQQQRFATLFGTGENRKDNSPVSSVPVENRPIQKPQRLMLQQFGISKPEDGNSSRTEGSTSGNLTTEWFFNNSYAIAAPTPTINSSNADENASDWNGVQAWSSLNHFSALP